MPNRLTLLCLTVLLPLSAPVSLSAQSAPSPNQQPFALISPSQAANLSSQRDTPLGRHFIDQADKHLADTPHPMPRLHTEGTLPHQGIRDQSIESERDFDSMLAFAIAFRLTGDNRYLNSASRFFSSWSQVYKVSLNPIDETRFDPVILAFDLTRSSLPDATQQQVIALFRTMATGYLDWEDHNPGKDIDNWNSHRIKLATLGAYLTGDPALISDASKAFHQQIKQNIRSDGSVDDFYKRDALHYVTYDLEPLITASLAAKAHGEDWFHTSATGSPSIQMAVDWLIPFATGAKTHQEFVNSKVAFDAARDKAGEHGYSGQWEPVTSVNLFTLVTWQDPHYADTLKQICTNTHRTPTPWIEILINASATH